MRQETPIDVDMGSKSDDDDDIPLPQPYAKLSSGPSVTTEGIAEDTSAVESTAVDSETAIVAPVSLELVPRIETTLAATAGLGVDILSPMSAVSNAPPLSTAVVVVPATAVSTITATAGQSEAVPSPATPSSSFNLSKEYGVSIIRNNFLTILRESPTQVLDRGGDFAGMKAVLEPLLNVMQSLTSAMATLPYRTQLIKVENLFAKWQSRRGQSLLPMVEDRTMQLLRERDNSQFELQRQLLEKKQKIEELGKTAENLSNENKRVADAERNQQLLVDSYKIALADIQAKLAEAENALKITAEKHQTLTTQWAKHQALVQIQSDDLEKLSDVVSTMKVLSDDDLRRQAVEEVKTAHRESVAQLAEEIRQAVEHL